MNVAMTPQAPFNTQSPHFDDLNAPSPQPGDEARRIQATFAHELANLLDGSLRNVALVMASLRQLEHPAGPAAVKNQPQNLVSPPSPEMVHRLETANTAMRQMAMMIQQLLATSSTALAPQSVASHLQAAVDTFTLTQAADHVMQLLKPIADEQHVTLLLDIQPDAAQLPVGPLFPVIVNAVRNSLQAIGTLSDAPDAPPFTIEVLAKITPDQQLLLIIQDNGPGLDPITLDPQGRFRFGTTTRAQGHGLGLPLARDIVHTLGGQLNITKPNHDTQHAAPLAGTQLTVHIPLHRLAPFILPPNS